ncbi:tripartite tricarboxylate transporter TctB family protein [Arthrobacter pigmenti]
MVKNNKTPATTTSETSPAQTPPRVLTIGVPAALIVIAGAVMVTSFGLGYWTTLGPGPGFFPFWIAVLLGTSSAVWMVQKVRGKTTVQPPGTPQADDSSVADATVADSDAAEPARKRPVWVVLLSLLILAGLLEILGYQLSMFAFLLFQLKFLGGRGWLLSIIISSLGSVGIFVLFTDVLQVTLPVSSIGFLENLGL